MTATAQLHNHNDNAQAAAKQPGSNVQTYYRKKNMCVIGVSMVRARERATCTVFFL